MCAIFVLAFIYAYKKKVYQNKEIFSWSRLTLMLEKFELAAKKKSEFINAEKPALAKGST